MITKERKLVNNLDGLEAKYLTLFSIEQIDNLLFVKFKCHNSEMFSYSNVNNSEIYNGDVCEIFIESVVNEHYYELEVAPNGTTFFADIHNDGKSFKGALLENNCFEVQVCKKDYGYDASFKIDLSKLKVNKKGIKFNAYRIETDGGETNKFLFALNPTLSGTFHKPEFFIDL